MAECPTGRTSRGIRTQFRLGLHGLGLVKGLYPIHVGDIMDTEQSSTSGVSSARELVSPSKGTRTRTVREYEETIDELQKENFDLKLQLHFYENPKKFTSKGKSDSSPDTDTVKIVVDLKLETEALRKDIAYKEKLLQEAVERAEKCELDFKELETKYNELQKELFSLSELPSKEEFSSLLEDKENLIKQNKLFEQTIIEKDQQIQVISEQIQILANQNAELEEKVKKRSIALQNLVYKNIREEEAFPEELRNIVYSATEAAKSQSKEGLVVAVKSFTSALNKMMSSSSVNKLLNESEDKENFGSPRAKCLKEEFLEKSSAFLPSQTETLSELSLIEGLKDALSRRNSPSCKEYDSLDSTVHDSFARGKLLNESSVNVCEKDILDYLTFTPVSKSVVEEKLKLQSRVSSQLCTEKANLIDIETISLPPVYHDSMCQDNLSEIEVSKLSNNNLLRKENEELKFVIEEEGAADSDSKHGIVHLLDKGTDALKAFDSTCTQTDIIGSHLLSEYEKTKLQKDANLSNNVDELREDVLLLLLTIEEKNKELQDINQTLARVQEDLTKALNTSNHMFDEEYVNERNELHERLAFSSSVNEELMKQLRSLEAFMEDLLKHKFESSMESLSDKSDVLSSLSRCLNESLKLSNVLSNHLSFCEGSKLFEECESVLYRSTRFSDAKSLPNLNASEMIVPAEYSLSYPDDVAIRTYRYEESIQIHKKSDEQMNKELGSQLCWRCWQQLNSFPVNNPKNSNVVHNISLKCIPYASSDSDIWSEPDRNVSLQRIGISLENSPVSSKSPRKSRFKDKRALNKFNSNLDTSSSEVQRLSRQRRHGSVSRRLFGRDSIKGSDIVSEKFYFLLAEKYSKLNTLLEALENLKDSLITKEVWMKMNAVVTSLKEAIQKLHITKENAKNYPSTTCQKCIMLELFMDLKSSQMEDVVVDNLSVIEIEILQQYQNEVEQLKEVCKEPFSLLTEIVDKRSQSTQSDIEQSASEFENAYFELNARNESLKKSLEEVKRLLSEEKEKTLTVQSENKDLYNKLKKSSKEVSELKEKEEKLSIENEELAAKLESINKNNLELISSVADLEQKKSKLSSIIDELTKELELNRSYLEENKQTVIELKNTNFDLNDRNKNLNRQLEEIQRLLSAEKEAMKLFKTENNEFSRKINDVTKELLDIRMKKDKLSVENKELAEELVDIKSKNLDLTSTVVNLEMKKERVNSSLDEVKEELQLNKSDLDENEQAVKELTKANSELNYSNENLKRELKELKSLLSMEQETTKSIKSDNRNLYNQINSLTKELIETRYKIDQLSFQNADLSEKLENITKKNLELTHAVYDLEQKEQRYCCSLDELTQKMLLQNKSLDDSKKAVTGLKSANADLEDKNQDLHRNLLEMKKILSNERETLKSSKSENRELNDQINNLMKELMEMRQKEDKLSVKSDDLAKKLDDLQSENFNLISTVKDLKKSKKKSIDTLDTLTEQLEISNTDLVDCEKLKEMEDAIVDLNNKNKCLRMNLDEVNTLLAKEEEKLKSVNSENLELCNRINDLKKDIFETKQKEEEFAKLKRTNTELRSNLNDKKKEASATLEILKLVKSENLDLCSQIGNLKRELMFLQQKEINSEERKLVNQSTSTSKNEGLISSMDDTEEKCCDAVEMLKVSKSENLDLCNQINKLKNDLFDLKHKEFISSSKSDEISQELTKVNKENSKLSTTVKDLKESNKVFSIEFEQLKNQFQKQELDFLNDKNAKIKELEDVINDLSSRNKILIQSLEENEELLFKEKELLQLARSENLNLSNEINNIKEKLFNSQQKELELSSKNEEIVQELKGVNQNNCELKTKLKDLEEKKKESSDALDMLTVELQRNKFSLENMNEKCLEYEKELNEQIQMSLKYEEKLKNIKHASNSEKELLIKSIQDLKNENKQYQAKLESAKNLKVSLEEKNDALCANLQSKCLELASLQEKINNVLESKGVSSSKCQNLETELENTKEILKSLQEKCSAYEEEVISKFKISEDEYCQKLKELETKSLSEKEEFLAQISKLFLERKDILQKLDSEKELYEKLVTEKEDLNKKFIEQCEQISSLQQLNEDLRNKQQNMLQRKEFFEKALHSSNAECDNLSKDLKMLRETLQNLESKCVIYEKEIVAAAGIKDNFVECLLTITNEISCQRQKLNELCKGYGREISEVYDETSVSDFIPTIDDDNIKKMCHNLSIESKRLLLSVDVILELIKSFYLKSLEGKNIEEAFNQKTANMSKQVEYLKTEGDRLKSQNDHLKHIINELQQSISEKERSAQYSAYEIQSLKEKIHSSESEIKKGNELLKRKDEEVTELHERILNLQSYVNTIMANKTEMLQKHSPKLLDFEADSVSSNSQLPSSSALEQVSIKVQTDKNTRLSSSDESLAVTEKEQNSCCKQLLKKYQTLQTKLVLCKKRIEILENEKNDLREHYLNQIKVSSATKENEELINSKLVNLECELEKKKAFISELKAELLKTCNSLIDKEKEVHYLQMTLSKYEKKSKDIPCDIPIKPVGCPKTVDANIGNLRNYKWKLIQTIFDIQKKFYEKRGIHLNYMNKFRDHVNSMYAMQLTRSLSKTQSLPLLESPRTKLSSIQEDKLKHLVGLEIDIECLENLKIFLNRFFVPCMLQTSQDLTSQLSSDKKLSLEPETKQMNEPKIEIPSSLGHSFSIPEVVHLTSEDKLSLGKSLSFENFVSSVSHSLDCIQSLFTTIGEKYESLEIIDLPSKESVNKAEVNNLLVKISEEVQNLQGGVDKLFSFNAHLKNLDFIVPTTIPLSFSRPDVSDRESLMSEETIGISRSESPLSFDELGSLKLSCPETLHLEEQTIESKIVANRGTVVEGKNASKVTAIEGSCDSVCQRSHYSSPDLGIESDPNHESSAPEQKEEAITFYRKTVEEKKFVYKLPQTRTALTETESAGRFKGITFCETLYSIGKLQHYELLKREVQESLVGIKSVLLRTGDGLHHVAKYTSPRKTLEYSTLKAIKDSCANIEVCLKEAYRLINEFWTAPCPTEREWKALIDENQSQREQLTLLKEMIQKQEKEYKKAIKRLENAQLINAHMEKKISKKLVKTKKDIRLAEQKLLECQNLPPVPKYPSEHVNLVPQTKDL